MPPPPPKPPRGPHHPPVPSSAISSFLEPERLSTLLAPFVPEAGDRAFVVRCLIGEGPAHHRGANYVLLALLGEVLAKVGPPPADAGPTLPVPLRLPPHLAAEAGDDAAYPIGLPERALARLAAPGTLSFDAMADCVIDGPPQHAVANVAMVCLLDGILRALEAKERPA